jgi:hypothetical protein
MEAMRGTAWVLTHALVNMTNACLSSSFLRTDRHGAFGSRFGPIAKWPFLHPNQVLCKEPQIWLVAKKGKFPAFFFRKPPFFRNQDL